MVVAIVVIMGDSAFIKRLDCGKGEISYKRLTNRVVSCGRDWRKGGCQSIRFL